MPATPPYIEPDWPVPDNVVALSTTRVGGRSAPPYASFNLAHHVGDSEAAVASNRALLGAALPAGTHIQWLTQVHGTRVVAAEHGSEYPQADAVWSRDPGAACAVMTADCLPVLFCSAAGDTVAAAHAGWRGLLGGVLEATITAMGSPPGQLLAWLGPAIGPGAFEVGPEVRSSFLAAGRGADADTYANAADTKSKAKAKAKANNDADALAACFVPNPDNPGHYFADLYALARLRLRAAGVTRVYGGNLCTFSDPEHYFSYRRDGQTGRMASLILLQ